MRTRMEKRSAQRAKIGIALALSLAAGCASDLWYKKGAGTEALTRDKAACRAEVAQLSGVQATEAFEQCMGARDWFHVATAGRRSAAAPAKRKAASARPRETKPVSVPTTALVPASPVVVTPQVLPPTPAPATEPPPLRAIERTPPPAPAAAVAEPTPASDALETTPSVDAGPEAAAVEAEMTEEELEEIALTPEPVDPKSRQFWIKLGAGPTQLAADQKTCRRELGLPDTETQPSRWGQSDDFDACMRLRGWGGGSIQAVPNR